ncbi:hypothetical protein [Photobacterium lutimaris]|uniref:hypothetical protein n=1 Tax=Photobacterium lutimaris TaxID=388278 RepID=UPI001414D9E5|nr:hypothetical protein [Photobacterium lutimaris]
MNTFRFLTGFRQEVQVVDTMTPMAYMRLGPVPAIEQALERANMPTSDLPLL